MTPQEILLEKSIAHKLSDHDVGQGITLSFWRNMGRDVNYENIKNHTFSFYIKGGNGSVRKKYFKSFGGSKKVCVIPEGAYSQWGHSRPLEFLHVSVPDNEIRRLFSEIRDEDARVCTIPELSFYEDLRFNHAFQKILYFYRERNYFGLNAAVYDMLSYVVLNLNGKSCVKLRGGLTRFDAQNLKNFIEDNLDVNLTLSRLSAEVGLSEFHLQRMFKKSFGVSPCNWIRMRRIHRAKTLIKNGMPLAEVAIESGFFDQSHMSRSFQITMMMTPGEYRKHITN